MCIRDSYKFLQGDTCNLIGVSSDSLSTCRNLSSTRYGLKAVINDYNDNYFEFLEQIRRMNGTIRAMNVLNTSIWTKAYQLFYILDTSFQIISESLLYQVKDLLLTQTYYLLYLLIPVFILQILVLSFILIPSGRRIQSNYFNALELITFIPPETLSKNGYIKTFLSLIHI
eukprot:TRINITY_DN13503_c0_g1_i2.p1 TRINITY_DN13503_c0_g1~~TRINITY_DN13503_c0_g1_i2.p1  ORF type:complete len:171 (-),score=0.05 TRINITY_DN13503_c0_g1_i2:61-573(-)